MTTAWRLVRDAYGSWSAHKAPRLGAALAYYTALSLAPLLLVVIGVAGLAFGNDAARARVVSELQALIGPDGARAIHDVIAHAGGPGSGVVAAVIGVVTLLAGASGVFGQLQDALNTVWEVEPKPGRGFVGIVKDRFLSLTMVLGTGFLLLVSLVLTSVIAGAGETLRSVTPALETVAHTVVDVVSFVMVSLLFALMFKYLPDALIRWRDVWVGAVATALLFVVGKFAIGFYLGHAGIASAYGVAGSFVVVLVWVYYSAQILLFGAELTRVYAERWGARVRPAPDAVRVTDRQRAEQGMAKRAG